MDANMERERTAEFERKKEQLMLSLRDVGNMAVVASKKYRFSNLLKCYFEGIVDGVSKIRRAELGTMHSKSFNSSCIEQ